MWLKEIDRQIEAQACSSSMTKLTPDEGYTGMYYIVHPDYLDRLIAIVKGAECGGGGRETDCCPICGEDMDYSSRKIKHHVGTGIGFNTTCPYSNEYKGG